MPQPKSSRSSVASRAASAARASAATSRPPSAPRPSRPRKRAAGKPAAKRAARSKPAAKRATRAGRARAATATASRARRPCSANLTALRDTLRKGVVLTADGVKATLDDAVKRGRITRKDATELCQSLLSPAARRPTASARTSSSCSAAAARTALRPATACCARSTARAGASGVGPSFPIPLYDELTAAQIQSRLKDLTPAQLRKVRDYEKRNDEPQVGPGRDREEARLNYAGGNGRPHQDPRRARRRSSS